MASQNKFFTALRDVFVGAQVEGESGYINLMKIKARYFEQGVFPQLQKDIDVALEPFPDFRDELLDKLYDFFHRYFSESGSIYFRYTPLHRRIYEQVYTDDRDVILFWKTHMLYYVKTDRLFQSMTLEVDGQKFRFDASKIEHKKANEKRELIYDFQGLDEDTAILTVSYTKGNTKTKEKDILQAAKENGVKLDAEALERAIRLFERQSEVDYFINKNARAFLREQFNLWMYQYLFDGKTVWTETRVRQLQTLQDIAFKIIDFIAQFEDELVRIWNKPKFVLNSHYIITLDKLLDRAPALVKKLEAHANIDAQIAEWRELGMVGADWTLDLISKQDIVGDPLHARYRFLPLDTRHFPDLELDILALFDNLDDVLDGWLVHSENYQALVTLAKKFRGRVKCIHIDPPYNTDTSGFLYNNAYQHSSWLTMMENRSELALGMLSGDGSFLCHVDENEYERLHLMFERFSFPSVGTVIWDKRNPMLGRKGVATQHEYILWHSRLDTPIYLRNDSILGMLKAAAEIMRKNDGVLAKAQKEFATWVDSQAELTGGEKAYRYLDKEGRIYQSVSLGAPESRTDPKFFVPLLHPVTNKPCPVPSNGFSRTPETLQKMIERDELLFGTDESVQPRRKVYLTTESKRQISSVIQDSSRGKMDLDKLGLEFPYSHPVSLYKKLNGAILVDSSGDIIIDYFAGSGTTAHSVLDFNREDNGNRKYILIEIGGQFNSLILPRIKKVAFSDKWKNGRAQEDGKGISHFAKYFDLEQYEDTLRKTKYGDDAEPLLNVGQTPYNQYVFLRDTKMLDAVELNKKGNVVNVDLTKLYPNIDAAETLSCVTGKPIKRITADLVEFADGTTANLHNPDWNLVKPLIWW